MKRFTSGATLLVATALLITLTCPLAFADTTATTNPTGSTQIKLENPLGVGATIPSILKHVFNQAAIILAFIIPIIIIIGAFQMMFSGGNPEKFESGQKTITYAIIGYVIVLMANGIVAIVQKILIPSAN